MRPFSTWSNCPRADGWPSCCDSNRPDRRNEELGRRAIPADKTSTALDRRSRAERLLSLRSVAAASSTRPHGASRGRNRPSPTGAGCGRHSPSRIAAPFSGAADMLDAPEIPSSAATTTAITIALIQVLLFFRPNKLDRGRDYQNCHRPASAPRPSFPVLFETTFRARLCGARLQCLISVFAVAIERYGDRHENPGLAAARGNSRASVSDRACCRGGGLSRTEGRRLDRARLSLSHRRGHAGTAPALHHRRRAFGTARADPARHHRFRRHHADAGIRGRAVRPRPAAGCEQVLHHPAGRHRRPESRPSLPTACARNFRATITTTWSRRNTGW